MPPTIRTYECHDCGTAAGLAGALESSNWTSGRDGVLRECPNCGSTNVTAELHESF